MYQLIHDAGLEDFYALQDRAGRPVGDKVNGRRLTLEQFQSLARAVPGGFAVTLYVSGMTCRGCAWLVERLAVRAPGVRSAAVSLTSGRLELCWVGGFDFMLLQAELNRYGFGLAASALPGLTLSPLALRGLLCLLFALNGLLLHVLLLGAIAGPEWKRLFQLFLLMTLLLQGLVGATVFFRPAWDALRLRHWHSDLLPAGLLALVFSGAVAEVVAYGSGAWLVTSFLMGVPVLLAARLLADRLIVLHSTGRRGGANDQGVT